MSVKLFAQRGEHTGQEVPIVGGEFVIGRDPACQLRIRHNLVGHRHCRIVLDEGRVTVEDLGTPWGTKINGRVIIEAVEVQHLDRLRIGTEQFLFVMDSISIQPTVASMAGNWTKLRVSVTRGITVATVRERSLVNDAEIRAWANELDRLIASGHDRLVLNFSHVVYLSSQVIGVLIKSHRQCLAAGGMLKLCQIQPRVAEVFSITRFDQVIDIFPQELAAVEGDWPRPPQRPPCRPAHERNGYGVDRPGKNGFATKPPPVSIVYNDTRSPVPSDPAIEDFDAEWIDGRSIPATDDSVTFDDPAAQTQVAESLPEATRSKVEEQVRQVFDSLPSSLSRIPRALRTPLAHEASALPVAAARPWLSGRVGLVVLVGRAKGQVIEVGEPRLFIGRDRCCHIRPVNLTVSRIHAIIEQRDSKVFVRDLGSNNGTWINDVLLRDDEIEARDGDHFRVGPLQFAVVINAEAAPPLAPTPSRTSEDSFATWQTDAVARLTPPCR